jgi:hypothetical protein
VLAGLLALDDPEVPVVAAPAAPAAPAGGALLAGITLVRMNLIASLAPAAPVVPTGASAFWTQPVIVTLSLEPWAFSLGLWAAKVADSATASAAHALIHTL